MEALACRSYTRFSTALVLYNYQSSRVSNPMRTNMGINRLLIVVGTVIAFVSFLYAFVSVLAARWL